jgi:hypothetical protein
MHWEGNGMQATSEQVGIVTVEVEVLHTLSQ